MTPTREQIQDVLQAMAICPWGTKSYRGDVFEINRTIRAALESALLRPSREKKLREALKRARQYIVNGIELGYIQTPDKDDPANDTLPIINSALLETE